jgi:hypothetical protein
VKWWAIWCPRPDGSYTRELLFVSESKATQLGASFEVHSRCCFPEKGDHSREPPCLGEVAVIARWDDGDEWPICRRHERGLRQALKEMGNEHRVRFEETTEPS